MTNSQICPLLFPPPRFETVAECFIILASLHLLKFSRSLDWWKSGDDRSRSFRSKDRFSFGCMFTVQIGSQHCLMKLYFKNLNWKFYLHFHLFSLLLSSKEMFCIFARSIVFRSSVCNDMTIAHRNVTLVS
jgi:hypothetical protein